MKLQMEVPDRARSKILSLISECQKIIVGKSELIEDLLVALLSEGHVVLEGVPGVAKTTLGKTFAHVFGLMFNRIQGSPDILPSDITGTHIFDQKTGSFKLFKGPIFSNVLLIDEINRNTPKTNSAVLEALQERQVTIEGETLTLPYPFMVIATQSPVEFHGVFPLPEVLVDRFLLSLKVDYPNMEEEVEIIERIHSIETGEVRRVATAEDVAQLVGLAKDVYMAPHVQKYIVQLIQRTREMDGVSFGASPRASIALSKASRALAIIKGRMYVSPDDVKHLAPDILRHRIVATENSFSREQSSDQFVSAILEQTPIPERAT